MRPNGEYLHIDNFFELGSAYIHSHNPKEKLFALRPVFKIEMIETPLNGAIYTFYPGYIDTELLFYPCPLLLFYTQVTKMTQTITNYGNSTALEISIKLFSKNLAKQKQSIVNIAQPNIDFKLAGKIINLLNQYIESGREIDSIDFSTFNRIDLEMKNKYIISNSVDALDFTFYGNSMNRVGKDNYFWLEAEIRNMPKDKYIKKLILASILKQCRSANFTDYGIFINFDIETAYLASYGRIKHDNTDEQARTIKENLKLDMAVSFNPIEQLFDSITGK